MHTKKWMDKNIYICPLWVIQFFGKWAQDVQDSRSSQRQQTQKAVFFHGPAPRFLLWNLPQLVSQINPFLKQAGIDQCFISATEIKQKPIALSAYLRKTMRNKI